MDIVKIKTLGQLRQAGYRPKSVKDELRDNLICKLQKNEPVFEGIYGYDDTVIPDLQRAILARHNINLLGLRGQAKTRLARLMTSLLDEFIPVIEGSELNDDPFNPISRYGRDTVNQMGDNTPIAWMHRSQRYTEKLATPDVSVADLLGDVETIKAAALKLPYSDERVIHFGLIPRAHRGIFVINELPDLQARIQVALFNILEEGDIQIRGFKIRLPLDIQFVFTANPEDYTNRGSIVTPLKDRIGSQILTHYPRSLADAKRITQQEATLAPLAEQVTVPEIAKEIIEQIAFEARESDYVDRKSGVSARLTISAYESLVAAAERRRLLNNEKHTTVRLTDFIGIIPAITGKVELVYEGEQEGPAIVAQNLIGRAIRTQFAQHFPDWNTSGKLKVNPLFETITRWFNEGHTMDLLTDMNQMAYRQALNSVPGLAKAIRHYYPKADENLQLFLMEFALFGMAEHSLISRQPISSGARFKDLMSTMFSFKNDEENEEPPDDDKPV